jgi:preprotein translocase subunit SecE
MFFQEIFRFNVYKRTQGRITRQVSCGAIWVVVALGAWRMQVTLSTTWSEMQYVLPGIVLLLGIWLGYRIVNYPRFADFLIAVEAEMNKVSWPSRGELVRSSLVVIFVIFSLAIVLFTYDILWRTFFQAVGVLR